MQFFPRKDTKSLTIALEALIETMMIDSYESRKLMQTDLLDDKFALLKILNEFIDIVCEINDEHKIFVIVENGKDVLCLQVKKVIYDMIEHALLCHQLFFSVLKDLGLELNLRDIHVANIIIKGKQCTIAWCVVNDTHDDQGVIDYAISKFEEHSMG